MNSLPEIQPVFAMATELLAVLAAVVGLAWFFRPGFRPRPSGRQNQAPANGPRTPSTIKLMVANARSGDTEAMISLAKSYLNGLGVIRDGEKAEYWFRRAAYAGHALGMLFMGYKCHRTREYSAAFGWFKGAAEKGNAEALEVVGNYYYNGLLGDPDPEMATGYFRQAAADGRASAKRLYAQCLLLGEGLSQDMEAARIEMEAAAQLGDDMAARILEIGLDVYAEGEAEESLYDHPFPVDDGSDAPRGPFKWRFAPRPSLHGARPAIPEHQIRNQGPPAPPRVKKGIGDFRPVKEAPTELAEAPPEADPPAQKKAAPAESATCGLEESMKKLDKLIGLDSVKKAVHSYVNRMQLNQLRVKNGLPAADFNAHLVFTGNPGTGKTTVARILGNIFREIGMLEKGHVVEVSRADLIGEFVGQTAPLVKRKVEEALDGILFVDEAYSLLDRQTPGGAGGGGYGSEAIATLLKMMEDNRDRLVLIAAGYTQEMEDFLESNPGLKSRFSRVIEFEDFSAYQLSQIYELFCRDNGYKLAEDAVDELQAAIRAALEARDRHFGNARFVRNLFDDSLNNMANRVAEMDKPSRDDLIVIHDADIPAPTGNGGAGEAAKQA